MKNKEYKDCQLCKHLDYDTEGHFICGLDGDILDHEGIYCNRFEEYIEDSEDVENKQLQR